MRQYKVFGFFIQVILAVQCSFCGFERTAQPTAVFARGFSGTALYSSDNLWLNPASFSKDSTFASSLFYSPSPFQLDQLSNYGIIASQQFDYLNIAVGLNALGFSLYRETTVSITASAEVTNSFSAGISFHLNHLSIEKYGTSSSGVLDIGSIYSLTEQINFGFSLNNINSAAFGGDDDIPQVALTGISFQVTESAVINIDLVKDIRYSATYRSGFEFSPHEVLILRGGVQGEPSRLFGGVGVRIAPFQINYGIATHSELGLTHSIGITFEP